MNFIVSVLNTAVAPIVPQIAEEVHKHLNLVTKKSVFHTMNWLELVSVNGIFFSNILQDPVWKNEGIESKWDTLRAIRAQAFRKIEVARQSK